MPKTTKSSKKKKYNARFPPARIKKIMQTDEEVGKVAAAVPVIISRALEMFIESLITETAKLTQHKNAKTLSTSHIKQTIKSTRQFDFLCDLVKNVPDHQGEENNGDQASNGESTLKKGKGRPRKSDKVHQGRKKGGDKSSSDEDEDDDDEDGSEDTETDEESMGRTVLTSSNNSNMLLPSHSLQGHSSLPSSSDILSPSNIGHGLLAAGPASHGILSIQNPTTGPGAMLGFHPKDLPLSSQFSKSEHQFALNQQPNQPLYQTPSSFDTSTSFLSTESSYVHHVPHISPGYQSNPVLSSSFQEQQPIDLRKPLPQNSGKEDDDYDT